MGGSKAVEIIKDKITVSSVVGKYIAITSKGNGEYLAICPFHKEKTASFTISDSKQFYYCFGCGVSGDVISFLVEYNGINYREALEMLASDAGIRLEDYNDWMKNRSAFDREGQLKLKDQFAKYYQILELLSNHYHSTLYSENGKRALYYLRNHRNLSNEIIQKYQIGFANFQYNEIYYLLTKKYSFTKEDIIASGALVCSKNSDKLYNPFLGRIIFPILNKQNKIIAFGGRILNDSVDLKNNYSNDYLALQSTKTKAIVSTGYGVTNAGRIAGSTCKNEKDSNAVENIKAPKYINSSDSAVFKKGYNLYGLNLAQKYLIEQRHLLRKGEENKFLDHKAVESLKEITKSSVILLVEGYMDVITLALHNIFFAVAPLGTSIKVEQIQILWRSGHLPLICMDNDQAGYASMVRLAKNILQHITANHTVNFLVLKEYLLNVNQKELVKDPADFVNYYGNAALFSAIHKRVGLAEFIFSAVLEEEGPFDTPEARSAFYHNLMLLCTNIKDKTLAKEYRKYFYKQYTEKFPFYSKSKVSFHNKQNISDQGHYSALYEGHFSRMNVKNSKKAYNHWWIQENEAEEALMKYELHHKLSYSNSLGNFHNFKNIAMCKKIQDCEIFALNIICLKPELLNDEYFYYRMKSISFKERNISALCKIILYAFDSGKKIDNVDSLKNYMMEFQNKDEDEYEYQERKKEILKIYQELISNQLLDYALINRKKLLTEEDYKTILKQTLKKWEGYDIGEKIHLVEEKLLKLNNNLNSNLDELEIQEIYKKMEELYQKLSSLRSLKIQLKS